MDSTREETLQKHAYGKWELEGRPDGQHDRHWQEAETEVSGSDGRLREAEADANSDSSRPDDATDPVSSSRLPQVGEFASANK